MKIEMSKEAKETIKEVLKLSDKHPRIVFKNAGCAGGTLLLTLEVPKENDVILESDGVKFAIEPQVFQYSSDISIIFKSILDGELIAINNSAKIKCRCGKSFSTNAKG